MKGFHVKHSWPEVVNPEDVLQAVRDVGVSITREQGRLIAGHSNAVLDANSRMNLTRVTEKAAVLRLHIADSATAISALDGLGPGRIADVGSGAGYPGFLLQIVTKRETVLIESVKKKAVFLQETAKELGLPITVLPDRAEDVALAQPESFSAVVARAVSSLPALVELASPLLTMSGRLVAMKGSIEDAEVDRGDQAAVLCGMRRVSRQSLELPGGERRTILVYTKNGRPKLQLPRRTGLAQRQPLV